MENAQVIPFDFDKNQVRVAVVNNEPWFVAVDICRILGQSNTTKALQSLDDDERSNFKLGRQGSANIINESGLFTLILRCDDAIRKGTSAYRFRKWVTAEVLPAIRKYGHYSDKQNKMATLVGETIGTNGFNMLGALIKGKVVKLPREARHQVTSKLWSQLHTAFGVRTARDIPAEQLDAARNFIAAYTLEGEWQPKVDQDRTLTDAELVQLSSLIRNMYFIRDAYVQYDINGVLRRLQSPAAIELHDPIKDGNLVAGLLHSRFDEVIRQATTTVMRRLQLARQHTLVI